MESESGVEPVKLSMHLKNAAEVENCDGILFSGGEDLQPALYGKPEYVKEFDLQEIIPGRDHFEYEVMEKALAAKKPVLGICRGLQLINVYLGGTLVPDIPTLLQSAGHGKINGQDQVHINPGRTGFPAAADLWSGNGESSIPPIISLPTSRPDLKNFSV